MSSAGTVQTCRSRLASKLKIPSVSREPQHFHSPETRPVATNHVTLHVIRTLNVRTFRSQDVSPTLPPACRTFCFNISTLEVNHNDM